MTLSKSIKLNEGEFMEKNRYHFANKILSKIELPLNKGNCIIYAYVESIFDKEIGEIF